MSLNITVKNLTQISATQKQILGERFALPGYSGMRRVLNGEVARRARKTVLLAKEDGKLMGWGMIFRFRKTLWIHIYVPFANRRKGIGQALVKCGRKVVQNLYGDETMCGAHWNTQATKFYTALKVPARCWVDDEDD